MGEQFVLGRTIGAALRRAKADGFICSFDMLGEGARTAADAARYEAAYAAAIETVGKQSAGQGPEAGHGVSVKLSALSPRYEAVQEARVWDELYPRLKRLAVIAARGDINFTIDAEEADRLTLSLKLLDRLAHEPELGDWRANRSSSFSDRVRRSASSASMVKLMSPRAAITARRLSRG